MSEPNLSIAWLRAFEASLMKGTDGLAPLVVNVTGLEEKQIEVDGIRELLDEALLAGGCANCHTVANTIFPQHLWERSDSPEELFERYERLAPRIRRRNRANCYGIYFERMTQYGDTKVNQLKHIISLFPDVKRPTAYQLSIFDPSRDHTKQPLRGFPCLQQVNFAPLGMGKLALVANYPTQYLFEKAYGNYLGLYRLGRFVADQLKLDLTQMTCVVGKAIRGDRSKTTLRSLLEQMQTIPGSTPLGQAVPVGSE